MALHEQRTKKASSPEELSIDKDVVSRSKDITALQINLREKRGELKTEDKKEGN